MKNVNVRALSIDDWAIYKALRLASLKDSPDSFSATLEREVGYPDDEWISRLDTADCAATALPLVAEIEGTPSGLAWGIVHDPSSETAHIYQMWVKPEGRRMGVGRRLLEAIISWAQDSQLRSLALSVTTTNIEAISLYKSFDFLPVGEAEPLRPASSLRAQPMILELRANVA